MSTQTYVILDCEVRTLLSGSGVKRACLYRVYTDSAEGMADFINSRDDILPGSTIEVDDDKTVYRLRNDGEWVAAEKVEVIQTVDRVAEEVGKWKLQSTSGGHLFAGCTELIKPMFFDTSHYTDMTAMFKDCIKLESLPLYDTRSVSNMYYTFCKCERLSSVPCFNTSKVTNMTSTFIECKSIAELPLFDTRNVTTMQWMLQGCSMLTTVPALDMRMVSSAVSMFAKTLRLTECWLRNIKTDLQVGSATSWGHLLTKESLIHLIYECRDTGSLKTLTIGSANLAKLADVYVKTIDITDEMRSEDDLIDEKLPFVVCESTDEGAMLITDYVTEKNWALA